MRRGTLIALTIGVAAVAAGVIRAGAGAVAQALDSLHLSGLIVLALLHLPIVVLMGVAWRLASGDDPRRHYRDSCGRGLSATQRERSCPS